jgi:hypothetical protein
LTLENAALESKEGHLTIVNLWLTEIISMANIAQIISESEPGAAPGPPADPQGAPVENPAVQEKQPDPEKPWFQFLSTNPDADIKSRFATETEQILDQHDLLRRYCCLALLEPDDSINAFDLDEIYEALQKTNLNRDKDVLLMLLSHGGVIEPAYQISKLCKGFAREKFVVVVPRQAKSAATLIAIGADEIHMSILGQLGPIDPQLGGLPALGVAQALERIAALSQKFPGSAEMFATYLEKALTVEQIGYCERIAQSAEQYAQRLLDTKKLGDRIGKIAKELVHAYKDHSFVIDLTEAREHLGAEWVKDGTPEIAGAEAIYSLFTDVNQWIGIFKKKRMVAIGQLGNPADVFLWPKRDN